MGVSAGRLTIMIITVIQLSAWNNRARPSAISPPRAPATIIITGPLIVTTLVEVATKYTNDLCLDHLSRRMWSANSGVAKKPSE